MNDKFFFKEMVFLFGIYPVRGQTWDPKAVSCPAAGVLRHFGTACPQTKPLCRCPMDTVLGYCPASMRMLAILSTSTTSVILFIFFSFFLLQLGSS